MRKVYYYICLTITISILMTSIISSVLCIKRSFRSIENECNLFILIMGLTNFIAIPGILKILMKIDKLNNDDNQKDQILWLKVILCFLFIAWFSVLLLTIIKIKDMDLNETYNHIMFYYVIINMISSFLSMIINFIFVIKFLKLDKFFVIICRKNFETNGYSIE